MVVAPYRSGSCQCGAVSIAIDMPPFVAYNCHCSHCRAFANRHQRQVVSYHGAGAVWKWNVALRGRIEYEHTTTLGGIFALSRGRCQKCKNPVYESGGRALFPLAMVAAEPVLQLQPDTDIYYDSGFQQGYTGKRVLHTDLGSLLYEVFVVVCVAIPLLPWSIWKRIFRDEDVFGTEQSKQR